MISILERDPLCEMISLDPDTAEPNTEILRKGSRAHGGMAEVHAAVLVEGTVRQGDPIELLSIPRS